MSTDVSTIVSIAPFPIKKLIPQSFPGNYYIPAAPDNDFVLFIIERGYTSIYLGNNEYIKRPILSEELAQAVINDEIRSCVNVEIGIAEPGIFWKRDSLTKEVVAKTCQYDLAAARERQKRWFINLVKQADADWAKLKSPRVISEIQRKAAKSLQLKKEWDIERIVESISNCPACSSIVNPLAVVCPSCNCILKPDKYKELQFAK